MVTISFSLKILDSLYINSIGSDWFLNLKFLGLCFGFFQYFVRRLFVLAPIIDIYTAGGVQKWHSILI